MESRARATAHSEVQLAVTMLDQYFDDLIDGARSGAVKVVQYEYGPATGAPNRLQQRQRNRHRNIFRDAEQLHAAGHPGKFGNHVKQIAGHLANEVEIPIGTTCCGTAGDRGLLHPELVISATREVQLVLIDRPCDAYLSANRTCEMGLRHATGRPYESFLYLLEELSRPEAD